jgi:hypothetical protein
VQSIYARTRHKRSFESLNSNSVFPVVENIRLA